MIPGDRVIRKEYLDDSDVPADHVNASLEFMAMVNRYFGGAGVILQYFEKYCRVDDVTVLDLGTGCGDIPVALLDWAEKKEINMRITAIDRNKDCIERARRMFPSERIEYRTHSAFDISALGKFDYVMSSMLFHHCDDVQIVQLLKAMQGACRRGFVVNDLSRSCLGALGAAVLGVASLNFRVIHDATVSVLRGFRVADGDRYKRASGMDVMQCELKPWFRFSLTYHV